uniref:Uncharacterized protein n=1 Tax=Anguilla anguilla TaxID=7936 RepID=A0A0E9VNG2_ANGAN
MITQSALNASYRRIPTRTTSQEPTQNKESWSTQNILDRCSHEWVENSVRLSSQFFPAVLSLLRFLLFINRRKRGRSERTVF